jgi:hypothetical protein
MEKLNFPVDFPLDTVIIHLTEAHIKLETEKCRFFGKPVKRYGPWPFLGQPQLPTPPGTSWANEILEKGLTRYM